MSEDSSLGTLKCTLPPPCPRLRVVAVVLAAGTGSRMGGRPKCLLQREGQSLLVRLLNSLSQAGLDHTVLVLGEYAPAIQAHLESVSLPPIHTVLNPHPTQGQNSSLHLGLAKAQSLKPDWVMVCLADQPMITPQDLKDLITAVKHAPNHIDMLQPTVQGQPGNPVMLSQRVVNELLGLSQGLGPDKSDAYPGGKAWRRQNPEHCLAWHTNNPHYTLDMDSPDDLLALQTRFGIQLLWPQMN
jgi:molybdenum cofactor cytidylyltransferase